MIRDPNVLRCKQTFWRAPLGDFRARARSAPFALGVAILFLSGVTRAEPLRLRGDAFAQTPSPTGLLILSGEDRVKPWISAEGLAWLGAGVGGETGAGDVLSLAVKLRDPTGHGELRVGRLMVTMGSIRPLQLDGASVLGRTPWGSSLEAFGGAPVVPRFGERSYDWAVGGRLAQSLGEKAKLGVAYVHKRDRGDLAAEEVGADLAIAPTRTFDLAARTAYDLVSWGLVDALLSASLRFASLRLEAFATRRSPSRLLPATSLFSVLGDAPATRAGASVRWNAAPRLDLLGSGAVYVQDDRAGYDAFLRANLRTDDEGKGVLGLELRRQGVPQSGWTGIRATAALPVLPRLRASTELELAAADHPDSRGAVWPWALVAMTYRASDRWDMALATEVASRPAVAREVVGLFRASYAWDR